MFSYTAKKIVAASSARKMTAHSRSFHTVVALGSA
jgi:hypothetical protein